MARVLACIPPRGFMRKICIPVRRIANQRSGLTLVVSASAG
ncbi:hypothetical protein CPter291_3584 [Collimonas pratensis]|uniref:Uncharacterized protein n=1 Tax=Collimonas pratensis TaxID=279113 RepID=A0ABN4MJI1_9BURK|nr:hypothetical protein CPter291_3584 [Collimonas pratensis]